MCWEKRRWGFLKASLSFIFSTNTPKQSCFVFGFHGFQLRAHPSSTAIDCHSFCCRAVLGIPFCRDCQALCCSPTADPCHAQTGRIMYARVFKEKLPDECWPYWFL